MKIKIILLCRQGTEGKEHQVPAAHHVSSRLADHLLSLRRPSGPELPSLLKLVTSSWRLGKDGGAHQPRRAACESGAVCHQEQPLFQSRHHAVVAQRLMSAIIDAD